MANQNSSQFDAKRVRRGMLLRQLQQNDEKSRKNAENGHFTFFDHSNDENE